MLEMTQCLTPFRLNILAVGMIQKPKTNNTEKNDI